jgi:pimeloyl-ACP methyl ester carboxylesterase
MPEIAVRGHSVHFQDTVGPMPRTVVFLHGAGGSHRTFRDQWAGLKDAARLVIPDMPGHARSGGGPFESIPAYAAWVAAFIGELELGGCILAGHSMGGAIALQAALDGVCGLEGLVLIGTGAKLMIHPAIVGGVADRFREFAPEMVDWMMARAAGDVLKEDVTADVLSTRPAAFLSGFAACCAFDVRERLAGIRVPALVVVGDDDRLTPLRYAEFLAVRMEDALLKIVRDAGHLAMLERPVEVNTAVRRFLRSLD